ncbi:MAG: type II toxin-antitoxin system PemK/MazF family toxin [Candidatus Sumerlaeota bacterium]|nr:type II toxin-antitoxin system PemK/MazF family toxin [Candidatus Sumerlaeota bacterium]
MMRYKVVLVPFPFDDLSNVKVRPAVCLTDAIGPYRHVILAFITSNVSSAPLDTDVIIDANAPGFAATGLKTSSALQVHRLMTVSSSLLRRELGILPVPIQAQTRQAVKKLFGL